MPSNKKRVDLIHSYEALFSFYLSITGYASEQDTSLIFHTWGITEQKALGFFIFKLHEVKILQPKTRLIKFNTTNIFIMFMLAWVVAIVINCDNRSDNLLCKNIIRSNK